MPNKGHAAAGHSWRYADCRCITGGATYVVAPAVYPTQGMGAVVGASGLLRVLPSTESAMPQALVAQTVEAGWLTSRLHSDGPVPHLTLQ